MKTGAHEIEAIERVEVELADLEFFAPVSTDLITTLVGQYQLYRGRIDQVAGIVAGDLGSVLHYFTEGNRERGSGTPNVERLFRPEGAVASLNSAYWSKAMSLTDVYDAMPQARRDEWNNSIREMTAPEFTEGTVRDTIGGLLRQRAEFFAERVDGIFRGLSSHHVTNEPQGFSKRMIVEYMLSYGSIRHEKAGIINDLRCVIAKFMGRDEPKYNASDVLLRKMQQCTGEWLTIDGGALRLRVYKKGTCHVEVHPDMAWRLNQVLASLYPLTIPAEFRTKPKKQAKAFQMMGRPLPFATLELLASGMSQRDMSVRTFSFPYKAKEFKATYADACNVLSALGGTPNKADGYDFDYPITEVLREVVISGCLPDQKAHQYYPTPEKLARIAVNLADIGPNDCCLEPSAGQGGIADHMPQAQTMCVEISPLHCKILESKGFICAQGDFLAWANTTGGAFDAIVMNPPFSEGRAKAHLEAASSLLKPGGRLVAILPASMRNKGAFGIGWAVEWSPIYEREFAGTSAAVTILKTTRTT